MYAGGTQSVSRKSGRRRSSRGTEEVALQITSMADIFTILLVFLLKSYSVSATNINLGKDAELPYARGGTEPIDALKIEVHRGGISLEGNSVLEWSNFEPNKDQVSGQGTLPGLVKAFEKERDRQKVLNKASGEESGRKDYDSKLLVIADKNIPYKTLKLVLGSASSLEFTDYKLVVVQED